MRSSNGRKAPAASPAAWSSLDDYAPEPSQYSQDRVSAVSERGSRASESSAHAAPAGSSRDRGHATEQPPPAPTRSAYAKPRVPPETAEPFAARERVSQSSSRGDRAVQASASGGAAPPARVSGASDRSSGGGGAASRDAPRLSGGSNSHNNTASQRSNRVSRGSSDIPEESVAFTSRAHAAEAPLAVRVVAPTPAVPQSVRASVDGFRGRPPRQSMDAPQAAMLREASSALSGLAGPGNGNLDTRRTLGTLRKGPRERSSGEAGAATRRSEAFTPRGAGRGIFSQKVRRVMAVNMTMRAMGGKQARLKNMTQEERHEELLQLVESTLENNDLMPLVRFVFDNNAAAGGAAPPAGEDEGERATNPGLVAAQRALKQVMQQESAVINGWCKKNAAQMSASMTALGGIQAEADVMERLLETSNREMQVEGKKLLSKVEELHQATQVGINVARASEAVNSVLHIVQRLMKAVQAVQNGSLHPAMQILDTMREQHPELFQPSLLPAGKGDLSAGQQALRALATKAVAGLQVAVQEQARRDFHEWLAVTRQTARTIGERAVRRAEAERLHEDALAHERKQLQSKMLESGLDLKAGKELVLDFICTEDPMYGRASIKNRRAREPRPLQQATASQNGESALMRRMRRHSALEAGRSLTVDSSDIAVSLLEGFDMSGLHRCIHVHKMLGAMQSFSTYYIEQRRLQLQSDLQPGGQVLETYKAFLAQLTGFFITEEKVLSSTTDLVSKAQVQQMWQATVTAIKAALDNGFDQVRNAAAMFVVKDYVLLTAGTLANHNFDVSPMMDMLLMNRDRYHDLLNSEAATVIKQTLRSDIDAAVISSEADLDRYIHATGLPHAMTGDADAPPPALPFTAPFSRALPSVLQVIEGYICDSVRFQKGLLSPSEVLIAAREHRDRFVCRLVCDFFQNHVAYLLSTHDNIKPLMMMAANAWCLKRVLKDLEEYTVVIARGGGEKDLLLAAREQSLVKDAGGKGVDASVDSATSLHFLNTSAMAQAISNLQESIERQIHAAVAVSIQQFIKDGSRQDWAPDATPAVATSAYLEGLFIFLEESLEAAEAFLPPSSRPNFLRSVMAEVEKALLALLVGPGVAAWNRHGVQRLADDIAALQQFAARRSADDAEPCLQRVQELADFAFAEDWSGAASLAALHEAHPSIDPAQLAAMLRKYGPVQLSYLERMRNRGAGGDKATWTKSDLAALAKNLEAALAKGESQ